MITMMMMVVVVANAEREGDGERALAGCDCVLVCERAQNIYSIHVYNFTQVKVRLWDACLPQSFRLFLPTVVTT